MKNLLLTLLFVISWNVQAQNWEPFPYDSVFFENTEPNQIMLPFIKTADNQIKETFNKSIIATSFYPGVSSLRQIKTEIKPWLGNMNTTGNTLQFIGMLNDTITLKLNTNSYIDTLKFRFDYTQTVDNIEKDKHVIYYLEIDKQTHLDVSNMDSISTYYFNILDSNFSSTTCFLNSEFDCTETIDGDHLIISKSNGITDIPNLGMFPFCRQYKLGKTFSSEISNFSFADRIHNVQIGDEIHTKEFNPGLNHLNAYEKMIVTNTNYSSTLNTVINTYDVWRREERSQWMMGIWTDTTILSQFTRIDTISLNQDYNKIPDGLNGSWYTSPGFYYKTSEYDDLPALYQENYNNGMPYSQDTINNTITFRGGVIDANSNNYYFYINGLSLLFFDHHESWYIHTYKPVYFKTQTNEWGDPYTDPFILETPEYESQTTYYINNNNLFWQSELEVNKARIYDIQGKLVSVYDSSSKSDQINIEHLTSGTYFLVLKSNTNAVNIKFVK
ncbi:MAG: T9SS type A sorting domain-containing protein [Flavobacteriales bacterium]